MKILFICNYPLDNNKPMGGVESVIYSLMQAIKKNQEHNFYFLQIISQKSNKKLYIVKENRVKYYSLPYFNFLYSIIYTKKTIKSIVKDEKIDIINFIGSGPMLLKLPRKIDVPIVVTQHGVVSQELKYVSLINKPKFIIKTLVDKFYLPKFRYRIFISEYIKKIVSEQCHYAIIPNPIYVNVPQIEAKKTNVEKRRPEVIVVGNISRLKNQLLVILALNDLLKSGKDFQIKIIGNIKDRDYYKELRTRIDNDENISSRLSIIKGLNRDETLFNIKNADILLVTSLQENLPMVIGEAMLLSKIVVAPEIGGIPEMIINNKTGYIYKPNDVKSLCDALSHALEINQKNEILIEMAKNWAVQTYSPENVFIKTIDFFKDILDGNKKQ